MLRLFNIPFFFFKEEVHPGYSFKGARTRRQQIDQATKELKRTIPYSALF